MAKIQKHDQHLADLEQRIAQLEKKNTKKSIKIC
jgi:BMFP domain-containing protein YqiC